MTKIRSCARQLFARCRGGDSRARRCTCSPYKPPSKWQTPPICHCEEAKGRRGALSAKREEVPLGCNLGKAVAFSPIAFPRCGRVLRDCHVASLLAMTRQGSARCTSALLPLNIPYKAVTDRRYRRNRLVHFYRHLVRTGIAFPRLPRAQSALAMTNLGAIAFLTLARTSRRCSARSGMPLPYNARQKASCSSPRSILVFPLPSRSSSTHNITNIFVLWKKHKNPRGNPKRSLIIPSRRDLTNAGKCDKIKAQRESGAFKKTDPVFGIARQDRFVADRLGTPAFAVGAPFFFRRGREENQNV